MAPENGQVLCTNVAGPMYSLSPSLLGSVCDSFPERVYGTKSVAETDETLHYDVWTVDCIDTLGKPATNASQQQTGRPTVQTTSRSYTKSKTFSEAIKVYESRLTLKG